MKEIFLKKKSGFKVIQHPVKIYDARGILFYSTEDLKNKPEKINLPAGFKLYLRSGVLQKLKNSVNFSHLFVNQLPARERYHYRFPSNFPLIFQPTPHKAFIDWENKIILVDTQFLNRPIPDLQFILLHEHAHCFYKSEKYADQYAAKQMLKQGFNPSQIAKAQVLSLSDMQEHRKDYLTRILI